MGGARHRERRRNRLSGDCARVRRRRPVVSTHRQAAMGIRLARHAARTEGPDSAARTERRIHRAGADRRCGTDRGGDPRLRGHAAAARPPRRNAVLVRAQVSAAAAPRAARGRGACRAGAPPRDGDRRRVRGRLGRADRPHPRDRRPGACASSSATSRRSSGRAPRSRRASPLPGCRARSSSRCCSAQAEEARRRDREREVSFALRRAPAALPRCTRDAKRAGDRRSCGRRAARARSDRRRRKPPAT